MKKLYVGNVSYSTSESELKEAFSKYPSVSSVKLIMDRATGQSRGFAFVEIQDSEEADRAMREMNGFELGGKTLKVNEARPQTERGGFGGGGGGGGGGGRGGFGGGGRSGGGRSPRY